MLVDRYAVEEVFARVPELADQTDPVLVHRDRLLDDDVRYQQVRSDLAHRYRLTCVHGRHATPAEVLLRLLRKPEATRTLFATFPSTDEAGNAVSAIIASGIVPAAIETMRALWQPGTKEYNGDRVQLPETTCYPRPVSAIRPAKTDTKHDAPPRTASATA